MTLQFRIVISLLLFFNLSCISAQQFKTRVDDVYGFDPSLYNGREYTFFPSRDTGGNQYFEGTEFENGSATIRSVIYKALSLNYDVYNQQLILRYKNNLDVPTLIILSDAWLESFSIKGLDFEIISSQDTLKRIYQVLGAGPIRIFYYWEKKLKLNSSEGSKNYFFSAAKKEMNVYSGNKILRYRSNKTFCSLFMSEKRIAIKEYLRRNKINVKKASDKIMTEVIFYCNTL